MMFSWKQRDGRLGNPQRFQNSKPRWKKSNESEHALDRKILLNANTKALINPSYGNILIDAGLSVVKWGDVGPSPMTEEQIADIHHSTLHPVGMGPLFENLGGLTPFRALMNAGDPNNTYNSPIWDADNQHKWPMTNKTGEIFNPQYTRKINQVSSTRRASNAGWKSLAGKVPTVGPYGAAWTGNNKYVYDGSDYIKFKKLQTKNRNFNDPTFGGDEHSSAQVALSRVRH